MHIASGLLVGDKVTMNEMLPKLKARADRKSAKRDAKKRQIAESAISALKELGYANTSLRDIAAHSDLSLGMLHYYFEDRAELIIFCVEIYKQEFVRKFVEALEMASGREQVIDAFAEALVSSIVDDDMAHRMWYDIRTQAVFDETFRPIVAEIEALLIGIVRSAFEKAGHGEPQQIEISYALLDGAFRYVLQTQIEGAERSRRQLFETFQGLLRQFL
ncbi:TetR/AcrR family transcriptional regulator [Primorskyibacter sp. S87]|uniref:TetR/AcrR family transcriptional regulator n=1 Tax=Primorskyibacter sp. S87 TaxID=3415126 RepID=UPI003C7BC987